MSLTAVPRFEDRAITHATIRAETRNMLSEIVRVAQDLTAQDIEEATDAILSVFSTAFTLGFREGQEECCGMGAFPNPFVKEPNT